MLGSNYNENAVYSIYYKDEFKKLFIILAYSNNNLH